MDFELFQDAYRAVPLLQFDWLEHGFGTRSYILREKLATLRQIHSANVVYVDHAGCLAEGDALLSDTPGLLAGVKTADCFPILLADEHRRKVAAVHAGWRGTVAGVVHSTIQAMMARWGTLPENLHVAIGPGIGPCCFEVGPEVAIQFGQPSARTRVDLAEANRRQLIAAGVAAERIYTADLCTVCHAVEFHSFRRDREKAGRMFSVIGVKS